jgi:membrane protein implicated in regulation of membrane protease activity
VDDPSVWQWVWLGTAVLFALGEMANPGSFFLLPFAIGAAVAAVLAILGVPVAVGWAAFVIISVGSLFALRPLAQRLDRGETVEGIGAKRLIGEQGSVIEAIGGAGDLGLVRINREEWRAETVEGTSLEAGAPVRVVEVRGTRVVVHPVLSQELES